MSARIQWGLLLLILAAGLGLRLTGVDWDAYEHYHPDERYVSWVATTIEWPSDWATAFQPTRSSFNPYYWPPDAASENIVVPQDERRAFAYGHVPLYMGVAATRLLERSGPALLPLFPAEATFATDVLNGDDLVEFNHLTAVGRALTALVDVGTVLLVFLLGRVLYGPAAGLLAAALLAVAVLHVQLAHFFTVDTYLTFFTVAALLGMVRALDGPDLRRRWLAAAAVATGLAVGAKFAAVVLALPLVLTVWAGRRRENRPVIPALTLTALGVALTFALTNPFAVIDWGCDVVTPPARVAGIWEIGAVNWRSCYLDNIVTQRAMVSGAGDVGFTRQYAGTLPWLYPAEMLLRWGLGWPLGLLSLVGFGWATVRGGISLGRHGLPLLGGRGRRWAARLPAVTMGAPALILLSYTVPYFLTTGGFYVKFMRYMQPLTPFLVLYGAALLTRLPWRRSAAALGSVVLVASALYALAFTGIYRTPHPWVAASTWIYDNIPPGAHVYSEQWDEPLPSTLFIGDTLRRSAEYRNEPLTWLTGPDGRDDVEKLLNNVERLVAADVIVLASNRIYGVVPRQPERFPLSSQYHQLLLDGSLGYGLAHVAGRAPNLAGYTVWPDPFGWAGLVPPAGVDAFRSATPGHVGGRFDESFTVYDQPLVLIFTNEERLSRSEMLAHFQLPDGTPLNSLPGIGASDLPEEGPAGEGPLR